jgi:cell division protein FtsW (lipid II flippase)
LQSEKEKAQFNDPYVDQYSPIKVGRLNRIVAVFLAVCVLLIPVMLLFLKNMSKEAMAWLVFVFVLLFCVLVTVLTEAKVLEIFVATAA